ncbi:MAG: lipopolysaccharide transport periplasmic protein LptA [Desulfuromonadales bacterium]|nr:lipopolysaccharide transport periplasmic protein LptA [Desulfuromonadales bacterium]
MIRLICALLLVMIGSLPAWGAALNADRASGAPIDVSAERLDVDDQAGTAIFSGQVVVKRDDMTIHAETLTLYRDSRSGQVERIEASGGVRVVQLDRVGTAREASFNQLQETLVLTGEASIRQGQNLVTGDEIVLYLKENRSLVKSGEEGRVRAVFFPEQERN